MEMLSSFGGDSHMFCFVVDTRFIQHEHAIYSRMKFFSVFTNSTTDINDKTSKLCIHYYLNHTHLLQ